ncbi:hypothetical protein OXPF_42260 [Oxobacter pfennigii]|uniref:DUF3231 family protein n=1 Tax=Oxobacter pfennigii TaxID=36849 RepID=A0A0P8W4M2_9CLOT|nr:DUF3231 family protein [Oxobacter pfennigii]KPU42441.1 hypothetical protein OXPF_42260 [Oxobacter pfennigii]
MDGSLKIPLIVSEISGLYNTYMNDSAAICMLKYFLKYTDDEETRTILYDALSLSERHLEDIKLFLEQDGLAIPDGFGEDDVNESAPRLFTEPFYLFYLGTLAGFGMDGYSLITRYTARPDVMDFFIKCLHEASELLKKVTMFRLSKGLYLKAPRVEVSNKITYIEKDSFLSGIFGKPRPLLAREATNVFAGSLFDLIWRGISTGFGQVAKSKEVRDFMFKGRDITSAHFEEFSRILNDEDIPVPSISDSFITSSTVPPFSDKLMMFQALSICAMAVGVDGAAIASSMRLDLLTTHSKFGAEIIKYSALGTDIMIKNGWLEQPPQIIRHDQLSTV